MEATLSYSSIAPGKPAAYYKEGFKQTKEKLTTICKYVWSPIIWKDGIRLEKNFVSADLGVLDMDDGLTIKEAVAWLESSGFSYIIAPTKSHQRAKGRRKKRDRYRLIMKFEKTITDLGVYKYNMRHLASSWGGDRQCTDGARFFFPSLLVSNWYYEGQDIPIKDPPPLNKSKRLIERYRYRMAGILPDWADKFLTSGLVFGDGRQYSCFSTACKMFELGMHRSVVSQRLHAAPFDRTDFGKSEIDQAINSAERRIRSDR